jgi:predicted MPP superfamily phosphohydrolase
MKVIWINDIHLEFLDHESRVRFMRRLARSDAESVLIAGDIGQSHSVVPFLKEMEAALERPIYFVLGNHDYYYGSISSTRTAIRNLVGSSHYLRWVTESDVTMIADMTALIGHDGWGDGRLGDSSSRAELNDFLLIEELTGISRAERLQRLKALGDEAGCHFSEVLPQALRLADHVVVLTHVPPFAEATWYRGAHSEPDWLPFFACKAAGDVLKKMMNNHLHKRMTVLCGHTHGSGVSRILPNLVVYTGAARYSHPTIHKALELD